MRRIGILLGLLAGFASGGEVYRWQDSSGQWHFGSGAVVPDGAERAEATNAVSIVKVAPVKSPYGAKSGERNPRLEARTNMDEVVKVAEAARKAKEKCERWRERLRRSRLGLRDHEAQAAYERECVLNVRW